MICNNCGAEISGKELLCPYCGAENADVAKKEQQDYIREYNRKKRALKKVPDKVVKKTTKVLVYGAGIVLGVIVLAFLVIMAFSNIMRGDMLAKQEKEINKLEEYYDAGDYSAMSEYLDKIDKRGGSYEKYCRVADLYNGMDWRIESLKSNSEFVVNIDLDATLVERDLEWCIEILYEIHEMEELGFPYGEKTGALFVREQYVSALKEYALLTDEEIQSAMFMYNEEENDYLELAEISIQRMEENFR